MEKIRKMSWDPTGLSGVKLSYFKGETKGNVRYDSKVDKEYPWPVQGEMLSALRKMSVNASSRGAVLEIPPLYV